MVHFNGTQEMLLRKGTRKATFGRAAGSVNQNTAKHAELGELSYRWQGRPLIDAYGLLGLRYRASTFVLFGERGVQESVLCIGVKEIEQDGSPPG